MKSTNTNNTNNTNLQNVYNHINNFDLLAVVVESAHGTEQFFTSGIMTFRRDFEDIGFKRLCADSVIPDGYVKEAKINDDGSITINYGEVTYTLTPIKEKSLKNASTLGRVTLDTFMCAEFADEANITIDGTTVFIPINPDALGETTNLQQTRIKVVLDNMLDGAQVKYQHCRVPAFSVEFSDSEYKIYGHLYNIEDQTYMNSVPLYDSAEDFNGVRPYAAFAEYARKFI